MLWNSVALQEAGMSRPSGLENPPPEGQVSSRSELEGAEQMTQISFHILYREETVLEIHQPWWGLALCFLSSRMIQDKVCCWAHLLLPSPRIMDQFLWHASRLFCQLSQVACWGWRGWQRWAFISGVKEWLPILPSAVYSRVCIWVDLGPCGPVVDLESKHPRSLPWNWELLVSLAGVRWDVQTVSSLEK